MEGVRKSLFVLDSTNGLGNTDIENVTLDDVGSFIDEVNAPQPKKQKTK
jgi:hypothetical protein